MSLKPPKKSDLNKAWMKSKPDKAKKIQPEYHLIVTEGTNTEPAYFQRIADIINERYREKINLKVVGGGNNTINLFNKTKELAVKSSNVYRHVWVVYDTDDFPAEHVDKVEELCSINSNSETTYHAIWSNQCVELWFLLHFSYMHSDIDRTGYWPKLSEILKSIGVGEYKKNREDMYAVLRPFMDIAFANAKRLEKVNEGRPASQAAPGTRIHWLIGKLRPYL